MADTPTGPFYATFAQRIRALVLDWFVFLAVLLAVVTLAATVHFGQRARLGLFTGLIALAVLYEPVLIATRGRTIGHSLCNLRVVAPTATGRLPFWKAFVRWFLKGLTGLASFATMGATERNQALHDLPFGTTVQAADLSKATASQFMSQRAPAPAGQRPSRSRRMLVIIGYLVLLFILLNFADSIGASATCLTTGRCEPGERLLVQVLNTGWLAASIAVCVFGWQGRLPGARCRPVSAPSAAGSGQGAA